MKSESKFKYVFWSLVVVVSLLVIPLIFIFKTKMPENEFYKYWLILFPVLFIIPAYIALIGRLVYLDAAKRGMDPWLWATVAVFVPNLVGLIIYLIVRYSFKNTCIKCGKGIQNDFKICPYCGQSQELKCEKCQKEVLFDWNVCPYCMNPLPRQKTQD